MKSTVCYIVLIVSSVALAGCAANWKVKAACDTTKKCSIEGEIGGTFPKSQSLSYAMLSTSDVSDAADFYIETSGSTIAYPATGTVTINLINSSTGAIRASKLFAWTRTGTVIKLTDPSAVNAWAAASGGDADSMKYRMTRFQSDYGIGNQTIAAASVYEGTVTATATSTFQSCTPPGVYSPYPCAQ
jgi:hypothetical protein